MTTMDDNALFVDTNVLIYATDPRSPLQPIAAETLRQASDSGVPLVVSPQVLREYLAVAGRPATSGGVTPLDDVLDNIETFRVAFRVVEDSSAVIDRLIALVRQLPVAGRRVHDTNIVATMLVHGVRRLLTHNTGDFERYAHLISVVPLVRDVPAARMRNRDGRSGIGHARAHPVPCGLYSVISLTSTVPTSISYLPSSIFYANASEVAHAILPRHLAR